MENERTRIFKEIKNYFKSSRKKRKIEFDQDKEDIEKILEKTDETYKKFGLYVDKNGNINFLDDNEEHPVCNFFIIPECTVNYYDEYNILHKKVYLKFYSIDDIDIDIDVTIIDFDDISKIDTFINNNYEIYDNRKFNIVKKAIKTSVENKRIDYYTGCGWINAKDGTWKYLMPKNFYIDYEYEDNETSAINKIFEFFQIAEKGIVLPVFSYAVLAIFDEVFRKANIEPNFAMVLSGKKENYPMKLASLLCNVFSNDIEEKLDWETYGYVTDNIEDLKEKAAKFKDSLFVIDGLMGADTTKVNRILKKFLLNYDKRSEYNKKRTKLKDLKLNRLCLLVCEKPIENNIICNIKVSENGIDMKKIIKFMDESQDVIKETFYYMTDFYSELLESNDKIFLKKIKNRFYTYKRYFYYSNININEKYAEIFSWLCLGYQLFLTYAVNVGALNNIDFGQLSKEFIEVLTITNNLQPIPLNFYDDLNEKNTIVEYAQEKDFLKLIHDKYTTEKSKYFLEMKTEIERDDSDINNELSSNYVGWYKIYNKKEEVLLFSEKSIENINAESPDRNFNYDSLGKNLKELGLTKHDSEVSRWQLSVTLKNVNFKEKKGQRKSKKYHLIALKISSLVKYMDFN